MGVLDAATARTMLRKGILGIGIRLDEKDVRRWLGSLNRIQSRIRYHSNRVPQLQAIDYMYLVIGNIVGQKGMSGYTKYTDRYEQWKREMGLYGKGFWRLYDDLTKAITFMRVPMESGRYAVGGYAWFSGVPSGVMDSGGKSWYSEGGMREGESKEIAWYGRIMEYGITSSQDQIIQQDQYFQPRLKTMLIVASR